VTGATPVPILVFLGLSVLELGPICDRQTDVRQKHRLMPLPYGDGGIITIIVIVWSSEAYYHEDMETQP